METNWRNKLFWHPISLTVGALTQMLKCLFCTMHSYNEQFIKNESGRMKRTPLAKNSKAEEVQFFRSSIPLCFCVHIPAPILFWCRYPLVCGYFVALLSGIFIDIGPCNKHFSKSNHNDASKHLAFLCFAFTPRLTFHWKRSSKTFFLTRSIFQRPRWRRKTGTQIFGNTGLTSSTKTSSDPG